MGKLTELGYELKIKLLKETKTQTWFAKQLGVSKQLLSNCMYGEKNLKLEEAIRNYIKTGEIEDVRDKD